jgi:uncharacterized protein YxjI
MPVTFHVFEARLPIGHDYRVEDAHGVEVFRIDGKLWRIPEALDVLDAENRLLFNVRGGLLDVKDTFHISRGGKDIATVRRATDTPVTERFFVELPGGQEAKINGDVRGHSYTIDADGKVIGSVSRRRFAPSELYSVEVAPGQDASVVVAITICLDVMARL